ISAPSSGMQGRGNLLCKFVHLFQRYAPSCAISITHLWQFIPSLVAAYPTWSPKNLCLSCLKRSHTSSKSSSTLCITISEDEMLQTEARKCCDYALTRSSKIWCLVAQ